MVEPPLRLVQIALLVGAWIVGYLLWIRPRQTGLDLQSLGLLLLVLLTFAGGLIGGTFWWLNEPNSFGWRLPDLGARLLGRPPGPTRRRPLTRSGARHLAASA